MLEPFEPNRVSHGDGTGPFVHIATKLTGAVAGAANKAANRIQNEKYRQQRKAAKKAKKAGNVEANPENAPGDAPQQHGDLNPNQFPVPKVEFPNQPKSPMQQLEEKGIVTPTTPRPKKTAAAPNAAIKDSTKIKTL
jgi:hypothetical protein